MSKFLSKIEKDKQLVGEMYSNVKKDRPKANFADLIRDFRVDEEEGMQADPRMEAKDKNADKL